MAQKFTKKLKSPKNLFSPAKKAFHLFKTHLVDDSAFPSFCAPFYLKNLTGKPNDQRSFVMKLRKKAKSDKSEQSPNS